MTRRVMCDYDDEGNFLDLKDRPVCLVKDSATKKFADWTGDWADPGTPRGQEETRG